MTIFKVITRMLASLRTRLARLARRSTCSIKLTLSLPPFVKLEIGTEVPKAINDNRRKIRRRRSA
ncbi:hypothetical protein [Labrys sp. 22185]|uniref:hypothetical protein n=1 Tax=Labrys sp. 22185 TaxID=3453888 RepID=UPI003F826C51